MSLPRVLNKHGRYARVESFQRCYNSRLRNNRICRSSPRIRRGEVNFTKSYAPGGVDSKGDFITTIAKDKQHKFNIITLDTPGGRQELLYILRRSEARTYNRRSI